MRNTQNTETMKIYRSILLNNGEEINNDNLGVSWSLWEEFAEHHANDINGSLGKEGFVIIETEVNGNQVDWSNTLFAMETRKNEGEVVLNGGEIDYKVYMVEGIENIEEGQAGHGYIGSNDFEDYNDHYDGELTKEDFFEIV